MCHESHQLGHGFVIRNEAKYLNSICCVRFFLHMFGLFFFSFVRRCFVLCTLLCSVSSYVKCTKLQPNLAQKRKKKVNGRKHYHSPDLKQRESFLLEFILILSSVCTLVECRFLNQP